MLAKIALVFFLFEWIGAKRPKKQRPVPLFNSNRPFYNLGGAATYSSSTSNSTLPSYRRKPSGRREKPHPKPPMSTVIETCLSPGLFALTYDDGIGPYTAGLLDTLKEKGVKATFFILGVTLSTADPNHAYNRKILRRMAKEGHVIGSHTYNHQDLTGLTDEQIEWQMTETASLIRSATGVSPKLMRPPFGNYNYQVVWKLNQLGYYVVNWNLDSDDWRYHHSDPEHTMRLVHNLPRRSRHDGSSYIILQHDIHQGTVEVQGEVIEVVRAKGYQLVSMYECLGNLKPYYR